jgi:hypothetical protein
MQSLFIQNSMKPSIASRANLWTSSWDRHIVRGVLELLESTQSFEHIHSIRFKSTDAIIGAKRAHATEGTKHTWDKIGVLRWDWISLRWRQTQTKRDRMKARTQVHHAGYRKTREYSTRVPRPTQNGTGAFRRWDIPYRIAENRSAGARNLPGEKEEAAGVLHVFKKPTLCCGALMKIEILP